MRPHIAKTIAHDYIRVLGRTFLGKTRMAAFEAAYGALDLVAMARSLEEPLYASHEVVGPQLNELFPAEVAACIPH